MGLQEITFVEEKKRHQVIGPKRLLNSKNKIQMKMSKKGKHSATSKTKISYQ